MKTIDIKGKDYITVNERIKEFHKLYPKGRIVNTIVSDISGTCIFKSEVLPDTTKPERFFVGHAYEKEGSSFINKTSYIENCETSAVGRALGMLGIGIDTSIASADEIQNAVANQNSNKPAVGSTKLEKALTMIKNATSGDILASVGNEIKLLRLSKPESEKARLAYAERQKQVSSDVPETDIQQELATSISEEFQSANTVSELVDIKNSHEDEMRTMSKALIGWLKQEYTSNKSRIQEQLLGGE